MEFGIFWVVVVSIVHWRRRIVLSQRVRSVQKGALANVLYRFITATGIYFFTKGFLLTRLVLDSKSSCAEPPIPPRNTYSGHSTPEGGCWHPKRFDKAVVVVIDALRYDFTVPFQNSTTKSPLACHNALPFLYDTAVAQPHNAFLLPFIADPPTTTLQRLKGLTTGTLPTFIDAGSNFAGTAIEEDNLLMQLRDAGRRIAHLGDDTWTALFPGYFEEDISHAYDSLNVWDLHTLDNGVSEHIFPLLKEGRGGWDVMVAHFLGVDHAGHRYGPDHPAMTSKLEQMDGLLRNIVKELDDDTLLVVMGDHGMDSKGDHGGESDDEVQAALWMYSKKPVFGRAERDMMPPLHAKDRPVNQIDLVPTLALLLGIPIPFNNLGKPIDDAFIGTDGADWANLADASRMASAGIKRYQEAYYKARDIEEATGENSPKQYYDDAQVAFRDMELKRAHEVLTQFQERTLDICKGLWARFDVLSMGQGIGILGSALLVLIMFSRNVAENDGAVVDEELEKIEKQLEKEAIEKGEDDVKPTQELTELEDFTKSVTTGAFIGFVAGGCLGFTAASISPDASLLNEGIFCAALVSILGAFAASIGSTLPFRSPLPQDTWSWLALGFPLALGAGFGANSFTIWEDQILLFFLSTFGLVALMASLRSNSKADKILGITQSVLFVILGWVASFSRLCREEQMPFCKSTYYGSATTSTSAPWQLIFPYLIAIFLPEIIKSYLVNTKNYEGFAPLFIGIGLRGGLVMNAIFWTFDAADDGNWLPQLPSGTLKSTRIVIAQTVIAIGFLAGPVAYAHATPCVHISTTTNSAPATSTAEPVGDDGLAVATRIQAPKPKTTITILGFANTHGSLYLLLSVSLLLPLLLVQKPMGQLALSICFWQILCLAELVDVLKLQSSPIAPVILALLGSFHFFKTGHQATLASIQWESAFIPLHGIVYPWSPILVAMNTFGSSILCALSVPLIVLWKREARTLPRVLVDELCAAIGWFLAVFVGWTGITSVMAGHLRRHLMLYRVFSPRWMVGSLMSLVVQSVVVGVVGWAVYRNTLSVSDIFGWA